VVAATNRDLEAAMRNGRFRDDLYYRLAVFPIDVPALAARREDVPLLADFFLREQRYPHPELDTDIVAALRGHDWPGNVRELRNAVERATILAGGGKIETRHFAFARGTGGTAAVSLEMELPAGGLDLEKLEAHLIRRALVQAAGNKSQAARLLGMTRRTLYSRMEKHGIQE